jgi:very-short-patch-repair endonuclease
MAEAAESSARYAKFRRQYPIGSYIADFFCLDARRVIELDGSRNGEDRERQADERRTEYLESRGYRVLRFWNEEVLDNIDGVLETIARHL